MDWRLVHRRAFSEARHALRIETGERLALALIVSAVYVGSVWWLLGEDIGEKQFLLKLIAVAVPVGKSDSPSSCSFCRRPQKPFACRHQFTATHQLDVGVYLRGILSEYDFGRDTAPPSYPAPMQCH
jgi:hypothetical protein